MPIVQIHLLEGRTEAQKRAMAKAVTEAIVATAGGPPENVRIIISDMARGDYSIGGVLISDKEGK
jgi:4-oxalocrotonate tautomerase